MLSRIILAGALMIGCATTGAAGPHGGVRHFNLARAVGCLVSRDWAQDDLHELGLRLGMTALVRYRFGPIPGTSPNLPDQLQIIIYSPDRKHGWLFLMRVENQGRYIAIANAYTLTLSDGEWAAGEGNGGIATYAAIRKYATEMAKQSATRVRLVASSRGCREEW
jgi:hypothetical protein